MIVFDGVVHYHAESDTVEERCHTGVLAGDVLRSVSFNESASSRRDVLETEILAHPPPHITQTNLREGGHLEIEGNKKNVSYNETNQLKLVRYSILYTKSILLRFYTLAVALTRPAVTSLFCDAY